MDCSDFRPSFYPTIDSQFANLDDEGLSLTDQTGATGTDPINISNKHKYKLRYGSSGYFDDVSPEKPKTNGQSSCGPSGAVIDAWVENMSPEKPEKPENEDGSSGSGVNVSNMVQQVVKSSNTQTRLLPRALKWD